MPYLIRKFQNINQKGRIILPKVNHTTYNKTPTSQLKGNGQKYCAWVRDASKTTNYREYRYRRELIEGIFEQMAKVIRKGI